MLVFVTGSTGFIGSAAVRHIIARGHRVLGLTRSEEGAAALKAAGATPHPGSLQDLESLRSGAAQADAVLHLGFQHDFSRIVESSAIDKAAIETMCGALEGSGRCFLASSGTALLAPGRVATEDDPARAIVPSFPRSSEQTALGFAERGVAAGAIRFAPSVHARERQGLVSMLTQIALDKKVSAYIGEGANVWPAVARDDAAELCALALEKAEPGARWHAVAEQGVSLRDIAEALGRGLKLPMASKTAEEAPAHFGFFASFVGLDAPASSARTQEKLGWRPRGIGLIEDLDAIYAA